MGNKTVKKHLPQGWFLVTVFTAQRNIVSRCIDRFISGDPYQLSLLHKYPLLDFATIPKGARVRAYVSVSGIRARLVVDRGNIADVYYAKNVELEKPITDIP